MSHFSGIWEEAEKIYYLLTDCECPIYFLNNKQVYDAAKWLVSKGVRVAAQQESPKEDCQ